MGKYLSDPRSAPAGRRPAPGGLERGIAVTSRDRPSDYQTLVRRCRPTEAPPQTTEQQLDALLTLHQKRRSDQEQTRADPQQSALDLLRRQMSEELMPVFEDLKAKYRKVGVLLEMETEDFLSGGSGLLIEVEFDKYGLQLQGTVTPRGIAFQERRYTHDSHGVVDTGPMLRVRNLTGEQFREFLCERIGGLVRSAMRSRPRRPPEADHA